MQIPLYAPRAFALTLLSGLTAPLAAQHAEATQPQAGGSCFGGTGGPNGDFDWVVRTGEVFFFDTTLTSIVGGPNGIPTAIQNAVNGVVDVRNLIIEPGGTIRVQGPNPMRVLATGTVTIRGRLDLSGFRGRDVATLNTGNQAEPGGAGVAGGGSGGTGNPVTDASTPRGGSGTGPFGSLGNGGGQGGESGYAPSVSGKNARRPGGGGGGAFAGNFAGSPVAGPTQATAASGGNPGNVNGTGALSGMNPAAGGAAGASIFTDEKPGNDFFGVRVLRGPAGSLSLMRGELPGLWAGSGGGAGGNAVPSATFPNPNWTIATDEKGGSGGGAGGALQIQALGSIVFGGAGEIVADGAVGGTGENTNFLDHIGGTGGGGSGGHVVLESATGVDFTDGGANPSALPRAWISALGPVKRTGPLADVEACCRQNSNGGAGGPGVIQLHVPDALSVPGPDPQQTDVIVSANVAALRRPLRSVAAPEPWVLLPTCDPFPRTSFGWFGGAGRRVFERLAVNGGLTPVGTEGAGEPHWLPLVLEVALPHR